MFFEYSLTLSKVTHTLEIKCQFLAILGEKNHHNTNIPLHVVSVQIEKNKTTLAP